MPIHDVDTAWREIGRIRTGQKAAGDGRPERLETFRLTSASPDAIQAAALIYGGAPRPWRSPAGAAWEVVTETAELDVAIPPGPVFSQWWERWTAAGRERQCDGTFDRQGNLPCRCPVDVDERLAEAAHQRACRPITRLALILPRLPDLGVWRLEVHGIIGARELGATMRAVDVATAQGHYVPGRLRLEQRRSRRPGQKPHDYGIPVLELELVAGDLLPGAPERMQLAMGAPWRRLEEPPLLETEPPAEEEIDIVADVIAATEAFERSLGDPPIYHVAPDRAQAERVYAAAQALVAEPPPIPPADLPFDADEVDDRLAELVALGATHRREPHEIEAYLATEAGLEQDPDATRHAPRRSWARVMLKLHAGDYDPTPLERATARAEAALAAQADRDPRSHQSPPDPAEVER